MKYYDVPGFGDFYLKPKNNLRETVIEPRQQVIMGKGTLVSSLAIPVFETKGYQNFAGVVGIDLDIGNLHRKVKDFRLYETGYLMLFSNQGIIVGGTDENQLGTSIRTLTTTPISSNFWTGTRPNRLC
jgi:methyl-accepting chemotaxis protein